MRVPASSPWPVGCVTQITDVTFKVKVEKDARGLATFWSCHFLLSFSGLPIFPSFDVVVYGFFSQQHQNDIVNRFVVNKG